MTMKKMLVAFSACAVLGIAAFAAQSANPPAQTPAAPNAQGAPRADPYANNAAPGTLTFPLAAPAGKDSNARTVAPQGAVNAGPFDPATWKYGPAFDAPAGSKVWNPAKLKPNQGGKVTGGTLF